MARNMSFMHTQDQIRNRTKTVTRRLGWKFLKIGDELKAVSRSQGLRRGEHPVILARIRVVDVRTEKLKAILGKPEEVGKEGLAEHPLTNGSSLCFIDFFCSINRNCTPDTEITRIEFEYLDS